MTFALYRHFNADGALLYVGMSAAPAQRMTHHASNSAWGREIATVELQWFDSKREALEAERQAIETEAPEYNCQHGLRKRGATPRKFSGHDNSELIATIETHLAQTGEPATTFSYRAVGDKSFLARLKKGVEPKASTRQKALDAIAMVQA